MLKYASFIILLGMSISGAVADDWTGQGPPASASGSLGPYPQANFAFITTEKIVTTCCTSGGQSYYTPDFSTAQPLASLPAAATNQNTLNITAVGAYNDPMSASGLSQITANIPLSAFARSSTVDNLMSSLAMQQQRLLAQDKMAMQGIAASLAMAGTGDLGSDEKFAVSMNWGTFGGQNGFAGAFAVRAADHLTFSGGIAGGTSGGPVGGRAGLRFAW